MQLVIAPLGKSAKCVLKGLTNRIDSLTTADESQEVASLDRSPRVESTDTYRSKDEDTPHPYCYPTPKCHVKISLS